MFHHHVTANTGSGCAITSISAIRIRLRPAKLTGYEGGRMNRLNLLQQNFPYRFMCDQRPISSFKGKAIRIAFKEIHKATCRNTPAGGFY